MNCRIIAELMYWCIISKHWLDWVQCNNINVEQERSFVSKKGGVKWLLSNIDTSKDLHPGGGISQIWALNCRWTLSLFFTLVATTCIMSSRSTPRDGSDFTHLPSSSASLPHVNGHGPDTPLPISPHDMSEDDNDEFLYQDSDPMLQQPYTQQLLKGNTHIKGPNTICKVIFLTICLAG